MNPRIPKETRAELHDYFLHNNGDIEEGDVRVLSIKFGFQPDAIWAEFDAWDANEERKKQCWIVAAIVFVITQLF